LQDVAALACFRPVSMGGDFEVSCPASGAWKQHTKWNMESMPASSRDTSGEHEALDDHIGAKQRLCSSFILTGETCNASLVSDDLGMHEALDEIGFAQGVPDFASTALCGLPQPMPSATACMEPHMSWNTHDVPCSSTTVEDLLWKLATPDDPCVDLEGTSPPCSPLHGIVEDHPPARHVGTMSARGAAAHNRKEWAAWEDDAIRVGVHELGMRWRAIAARLPGRSDDAVRNRWARLRSSSCSGSAGGTTKPMPQRQKREGVEQRQSWTAEEDYIIMSSVHDWGRRWNRIAEKLPKRTEHAIRNRWHRLKMAALDEQKYDDTPDHLINGCAKEAQDPQFDGLDFNGMLTAH